MTRHLCCLLPSLLWVVSLQLREGSVGYHLRKGPHGMTDCDWSRYMDFADRHLR